MDFTFERISYAALNARQQENYNFQKISAVLADFGFTTIRLSDDWNGADFLALHRGGETLKVQLKGRLCFHEKYRGKELWVCFPDGADWYIYPHDKLLENILDSTNVATTSSWKDHGGYSFPGLSAQMKSMLVPYRLEALPSVGVPK